MGKSPHRLPPLNRKLFSCGNALSRSIDHTLQCFVILSFALHDYLPQPTPYSNLHPSPMYFDLPKVCDLLYRSLVAYLELASPQQSISC